MHVHQKLWPSGTEMLQVFLMWPLYLWSIFIDLFLTLFNKIILSVVIKFI